jgi:ubiquitin conjugation factor E4 B
MLLVKLVDIFLHLSQRPEFVQAVAKDGRSYSKNTFSRACDIMSRHGLKGSVSESHF